jgi:hypothetical protein
VTKREARELVYRAVGNMLASTDFRLERSNEGYVRTISEGKQKIGVPFYDFSPRFEFSLVMSMRLDEVEDITWRFAGTVPEDRSETVTAIVQIAYFAPEIPKRFGVWSERDIDGAASILAPIVRERVIPFFDGCKDTQSLDRVLHHSARQLDTSYHPYRGMSAITVARLAGNPEFDILVSKYLAEMTSLPAEDRRKFISLAENLKSGAIGVS